MNINPINRINTQNINIKGSSQEVCDTNTNGLKQEDKLIKELDKMSMINNVNIGKKDYELNLSHEELEKRTHKDYLTTKKMLAADAPEYLELAEGDKEALKHLVKAALVLDKINMQLDNPNNLPFKEYLEKEIANGNEDAKLTKILFDAQKGVCSLDRESNMIELAKGVSMRPGKGVYPQDLEKEEFHRILINMLKEGKVDEVAKILNQRSVVERAGNELVATDYVDKFRDDFAYMASELEKAAEVSTNADFNEFLKLQAKALRTADPMLDAYADKKWATLQDTPLEFTITRENYSDELTETVVENPALKILLDENGIVPIAKDFLGGRVGIINKKGTEAILNVKKFLPLMAQNMPFKDDTFYLVIFDPPHLLKVGEKSWLCKKYGKLQKTWASDIKKGFDECMRVLKTNGTLIFKWATRDITLKQILDVIETRPIIFHKNNNTFFLVFMKGI